LDAKIGELSPTFIHGSFFIYLLGFLILYPSFSKEAKKLNYQNLLIIFYLLPSLKYIRYFIDVTLPLLFVSFAREIMIVLLEPYRQFISYWGGVISNHLQKLKPTRYKTNDGKAKKDFKFNLLVILLAISCAALLAQLIHLNYKEFSSLKRFQADLSVIPDGALVLTEFNLQYMTLFLRPDLRIIPSAEIGWPEDSIRKEYIEYFNNGEVLLLAKKTRARFFLENKEMYINPQNGKFLTMAKKSEKFRVWEIFYEHNQ
jgi:hypothetical protein